MRIYALAKELDIDSKDLVEVCRKAGITGKGSALASLTDDEVVKVTAFVRGGDKKAEAAVPGTAGRRQAPEVYRREDYLAPATGGKVKVLDVTARRPLARPEGKPAPAPAAEELPEEEVAEVSPPQDLVAAPPVAAPPVAAPEEARPPEEPEPGEAPQEREEELPPVSVEEPPPPPMEARREPSREDRWAERREPKIIDLRGDDKREGGPATKPPRKKRQPVIKLAQMPAVKKPPAPPKGAEVKAQKPEIRLTPSAIAGHRAGQKAPLEQLTKEHFAKGHEKPHKAPPGERDRKKGGKAEPEAGPEAPLSGKGTKRRRPDVVEEEVDRNMAGMAAARLDRQKSRKTRARAKTGTAEGGEEEREVTPVRRPKRLVRRHGSSTAAPRRELVSLQLPCTIRSFSEASGVGSGQVLKTLMGMGIATLNINAQLDNEMAQLLATELGLQLEFKQPPTLEETLLAALDATDEDPARPRPPRRCCR